MRDETVSPQEDQDTNSSETEAPHVQTEEESLKSVPEISEVESQSESETQTEDSTPGSIPPAGSLMSDGPNPWLGTQPAPKKMKKGLLIGGIAAVLLLLGVGTGVLVSKPRESCHG